MASSGVVCFPPLPSLIPLLRLNTCRAPISGPDCRNTDSQRRVIGERPVVTSGREFAKSGESRQFFMDWDNNRQAPTLPPELRRD